MSTIASCSAQSAPSVHFELLRQRRLEQRGLTASTARAVASLVFGEPRETIVFGVVADAGTLAGEVRR